MLRKVKIFAAMVGFAAVVASCASASAPLTGFLFMDLESPVAVTSNSASSKVGSAEAKSILGWIATGDCSIEAAAKAGGIKSIHHVDAHSSNIIGIIAGYKVTVYGE